MPQISTGWRSVAPVQVFDVLQYSKATKNELFRTARAACQVLNIKPAGRYILEHLIGCYGDEPIGGRLLVWPSNELLMARTGLSERAVRYTVRHLIDLGLISSKDSANGKRFCVRSKSGQVMDAYGLDLSPLLSRTMEFGEQVEALKELARQRSVQFDEVTVCRRTVREILATMSDRFPGVSCTMVSAEFDRLTLMTPRRDSRAEVGSFLTAWRNLNEQANSLYHTACGGNTDRHIKDNNDSPDQSCQSGRERSGGEIAIRLSDLVDACPDALSYVAGKLTDRDLATAAGQLRGVLGVHQSAWLEAREKLGGVAAPAFFVALQIYENDQKAKAQIRNFGGYFRTFFRSVDEGKVDLRSEIEMLRRKRRH